MTPMMMSSAMVTQNAWLEISLLECRLLLDPDDILDADIADIGAGGAAFARRFRHIGSPP